MNSAKFEQLAGQLEKLSKSGNGWRARCPVHGSKGLTLSVTEKDGGYIVAHCFSCGASGPDVVKALNLPISLLFPDDDYVPPVISREMKRKNIEDGLILQMSVQAKTLDETRTVNKSKERAKGYQVKVEESESYSEPLEHKALQPFKEKYSEALRQSPALRDEIVENFWDGIAKRNELWLMRQNS